MTSTLELRIDSLAFGGDGVGRHEGTVVFVPGTAPGDVTLVRVRERNRRFIRAEVVRIVEPGPGRVPAICPVYPACGGCQWQHVDYQVQFNAKAAIVERALARFGETEIRHHPAPEPFRYRRRARLTFRFDDSLHAGFKGRQSDQVVDIADCPKLVPALDAALPSLRACLSTAFGKQPATPAPARRKALPPASGEVELLAGHGGVVHAAIQLRQPATTWVEAVLASPPAGYAGLWIADPEQLRLTGSATVPLDHRGLMASARCFAQAHAGQDAVLRDVVKNAVSSLGTRTLLEFHAGIGNFTLDLAGAGCVITAVESSPVASALLRDNLAGYGVTSESADAEKYRWQSHPDCILLDPPREGAPDLCRSIAASKVRNVIYVSCDPMTLARDVATLAAARFRLRTVDIIDMMPGTYHIEAACFLSRN